jgi:murein DD-endopeptidase MepM/ murein hydrolase activator NlpD
MSHLRTPHLLVPLLLLLLLVAAPLPATAQSKSSVDRAKAEEEKAYEALRQADAELEAGLEEHERIQGKLYDLRWRIDKLDAAITEYGDNVTALQERAKLIVVEAYTTGGRNMVSTAFTATSIQDLITSRALFDAATTRDLSQLDQLAAVSRQMDRLTDELEDKKAEVEVLEAEQAIVVENLVEIQARAEKLHAEAREKYAAAYERYKAEQRRQAALRAAKASGPAAGIPAATRSSGCPFPGSSFINSWGYPRSGGRTHKGTDMLGGYGAPLYAMQSGSVRLNSHYQGGVQVYLYGDDGVTYYYAHLSGYPAGLSSGQRVDKGQNIGFNGTSGNASTPHLHLGMIVGGQYVNPYPTVRAAC